MKWFCIPLLFLFSILATYSNDPKPKVTFLIAEREYLSEETLPRFAKSIFLRITTFNIAKRIKRVMEGTS
jgi:hypothetical protein